DHHRQRSAGPQPQRLTRDVAEPAKALLDDQQQGQAEDDRDDAREGERREDSRALAQRSHHRRLNRPPDPSRPPQPVRHRRHPPLPSGIGALSSLWNRLKLFPSLSLQRANQPMFGIGCLSSASPPSSFTLAMSASMSSLPR